MTIKYKIEMLSDWHIGSGLDSGSEADALMLKDEDDLPYIPGKTIKGLLKDALKDINETQSELIQQQQIDSIFGYISDEKDSSPHEYKNGRTIQGTAFFSNAKLKETERKEIFNNQLQNYLYRNIASTKITDKGIAEDKSLRVMQVCIPLTIIGSISGIEEKDAVLFKNAFKWLRHLGVNRNRGLGRCKVSIIESPENNTL